MIDKLETRGEVVYRFPCLISLLIIAFPLDKIGDGLNAIFDGNFLDRLKSTFLSIFSRSLVFILSPSDRLFVSLEIDFSGCHLPVPPKKSRERNKI